MLTASDLIQMGRIAPHRHSRLFSEFLPTGYKLTTLDTVANKDFVVSLKVLLGTIITLYDDYADRPDRFNPKLLDALYRLPFASIRSEDLELTESEISAFNFAKSLNAKLLFGLQQLSNFEALYPIFCFDLNQFFLANRYSELLTMYPGLQNALENQAYLHHNMGIVLAGMIDLMSLKNLNLAELGETRSLFLLGQRAGRISNILTTFEREQHEGDRTNELTVISKHELFSVRTQRLEDELMSIFEQMKCFGTIRSFSVETYRIGIQELHSLHIKLKKVI